jgi:hypothetical protein
MWAMTTAGFFSAVQHKTDPSLLVVRTRDHGDAARLEDWYVNWCADLLSLTSEVPDSVPMPEIGVHEWSDYPWRVIMPRTAWAAFMAEQVEDLDYGNFKDAVKATQGAGRANVYGAVWANLLERLDPRGRQEPTYRWEDFR